MKKITIGLLQMKYEGDIRNNFIKVIKNIKKIAKLGAQIICLQELFLSHYFCNSQNYNNFKIAESIPGKTSNILSFFAKKLKIVIIASLFEKRTNGIYHNTAIVINIDGNILGKYRKMHIPDDPYYYEKFYFTPGDLGYKVFKTFYAKIGILICWDQWFPEAARITSMMGADILFYPTAIGWDQFENKNINIEQYEAWKIIQQSHSIANGIPIVTVNRVGCENNGHINFWGGSFITNSFGKILSQASNSNEENIIQEIDLSENNNVRIHWPFLRDRRIESYSLVTKRFID